MKRLSYKSIILITVIIFIAVNSGLLFSYYNFYLSDRFSRDLVDAKNKNHENISIITKNIEGKTFAESLEIIKIYIKNNGGYVTLKDASGNIIYANKKDISKIFSLSTLIVVDGITYELIYSNVSSVPGINLIRNFMLYEIIIVSVVIIIAFFVSSKTIINPIEKITKDISDYKFGKRPFKRKMPKNMQQIQNTFVDMVDSLELEKETQNQIIASISHDIKTPLTSVIGYADRLKNKELSSEKKLLYIDKIYSKALLIKGILEEFDDYQSCNIKETLKLEEISVFNVVKMIKSDFEDELMDKNIKLKVKSDCNKKNINVDIIKLKRVFSNIITNSVNHFKNKEGIIKIEIYSKDKVIIFEVQDNAGGIENEKNLKRIFEPLYTTDPSRKISGLGLSICKQIISAFGGNIYAKNNDMNGLSIIFVLPVYFNKF